MGPEPTALHIICIHRAAGVFHRPGSQYVMPEKSFAIRGCEAVRAVHAQIHALYFLRHRIRHTPSGQRQIGISPVADVLHPALLCQPPDRAQPVLPLIDVWFPRALRFACAAAALDNVDEASFCQFRAMQAVGIHRVKIGTSLQDHRKASCTFPKVILRHMK